ncbi:MAG TPA: PA2169 family four-helix-bundle protein [Bryobacteraceae bacterium]|nr:PA2169 family four-helix-bundle protein [Bryobacteraceae bacterium]
MAKISDLLNDLIATCRDSEEGFGKAAKGVHGENLRHRFLGIARERAGFAEELAARVRQIDGPPADTGHLSGIQHRGWRELDAGIRPRNDASFLAACEEGEENTLRHFEHALTADLPADVRSMVERQRLAVQTALLELRDLEQLRKAG